MAVSGGVDSVVLLDLLARQKNVRLIVAHFDHGIRTDSGADREFVQALAGRYGLEFEYAEGRLGARASEATARAARYRFLERVRRKHVAQAIITAHHQGDALETAILNLLRGTGRKGVSSLQNQPQLLRPLLGVGKAEIVDYAAAHGLDWREDSTNADTRYLRNYVRHELLPRLSGQDQADLRRIFRTLAATNAELDRLLADFAQQACTDCLDRQWFSQLPHSVAKEVMAAWLRGHELRGFDRPMLERLVVQAKTGRGGKRFPITAGRHLKVGYTQLTLA